MSGSCECGNEHSVLIKYEKFLDLGSVSFSGSILPHGVSIILPVPRIFYYMLVLIE